MKKIFLITLVSLGIVIGANQAQCSSCALWVGLDIDLAGAFARGLSAGVKEFLTDDSDLIAKLVYDGEGGPCGGNGGAYTGDKGDSIPPLTAIMSPLTDIPAEFGAYPEDVKIKEHSIGMLADLRAKEILKTQASLNELEAEKWAIEYRAQQRAIQAMTDALVMKKAYKELAEVAKQVTEGSYGNYSDALSTVASRRLTLDALMALRKRVIAARVRARAETMEAQIDTQKIPSQAIVDESNLNPGDSGSES